MKTDLQAIIELLENGLADLGNGFDQVQEADSFFIGRSGDIMVCWKDARGNGREYGVIKVGESNGKLKLTAETRKRVTREGGRMAGLRKLFAHVDFS